MVHPTEVWLESKYRKASVRAADGAVVPAPEAPSPELKMSTELTPAPVYAGRPARQPYTPEQNAAAMQGLHKVVDSPAPVYAGSPVRQPPYTPEQNAAAMQGLHKVVDSPLYNVAQSVPGLNIPLSAVAYGSHVSRGLTASASLDAVSAIPGAGLSRMVPRVLPNLTRGSLVANGMRAGTLAQGAQLVQSAEALAKDLK